MNFKILIFCKNLFWMLLIFLVCFVWVIMIRVFMFLMGWIFLLFLILFKNIKMFGFLCLLKIIVLLKRFWILLIK